MKKFKTTTLVIIFSFVSIIVNKTSAQEFEYATPLFPTLNNLPEQSIGGFIGIGPNWQSGEHYVECDDCVFQDGTGAGYAFGLLYQRKIGKMFYLGGYASFDVMNISSSFREIEPIEIASPRNGEPTSINVSFRHQADANFNYISFAPFIAFSPNGWLTFRTAPKASFLTASGVTHTMTPTKTDYIVDGLDTKINANSQVIQDTEFTDAASFIFGTDLTLMLNTTPSQNTAFSLGYTHYIPFMNTSDYGENFRINAWRIFVEFKYTLEEAFQNTPEGVNK